MPNDVLIPLILMILLVLIYVIAAHQRINKVEEWIKRNNKLNIAGIWDLETKVEIINNRLDKLK